MKKEGGGVTLLEAGAVEKPHQMLRRLYSSSKAGGEHDVLLQSDSRVR